MADSMSQQPEPGPDRVREEIEDILRRNGFEGSGPAPRRQSPPPRPSPRSAGLSRFKPKSPVQLLIAGGILLLIQYLGLVNFLGGLAGLLGVVLLVVGGVTYFMRPAGTRKYWRGELIELPEDEAWTARLYRFLYRT